MKGLRFQKRIRIFPGLRLNLSKSGLGLSAGVRGARMGIDARGRRYSSLGVPGTGISWRNYHSSSSPLGCFVAAAVLTFLAIMLIALAIGTRWSGNF